MIVWLTSYPRSGNTFLRVLLNSIFELKTYSVYPEELISTEPQFKEVVGHKIQLSASDMEAFKNSEKLFLVKTHGPRERKEDKAIYIIRDGRDSIVSYYEYHRNVRKKETDIESVIGGYIDFGSWSDHVKSWDPANNENTLLIKYEELITRPLEMIKPLSGFLNIRAVKNDLPSFEELKKINPVFFRKGKTGIWKNYFNEEQHILFWVHHYHVMNAFGYRSDMPRVIRRDLKYKPGVLDVLEKYKFKMPRSL